MLENEAASEVFKYRYGREHLSGSGEKVYTRMMGIKRYSQVNQ